MMPRCMTALCLVTVLTGFGGAQVVHPALFLDTTARDMPAATDQTAAILLADLDGDGVPDLLVGNGVFQAEPNACYLGDGKGRFRPVAKSPFAANPARTRALAAGDVDNDGDLDVVVGNEGAQNRLFLGDGKGNLADHTASLLPALLDRTEALALVDVDGDRDLDLLVINDKEQNRLYLNNGKGTFTDATATRLPANKDLAWALAVADVDGDGDADFCVGKWGPGVDGQNRLYLNDGKGVFTDVTATHLPATSERTFALGCGDVDGDGDADLVYGNALANTLLLNNGKGLFVAAPKGSLPADLQQPGAVVLGDLDEDGDLDMVIGNFNVNSGRNQLYFNNGKGVFQDGTATALPLEIDGTHAVALGDVDRDGDLDLVTANVGATGQQNRLYRNLTRQTLSATPFRIGARYVLRVYSRPSQGNPLLVVVPFIAGGEGRIHLPPFGVFGLDYLAMLGLPPMITNTVTNYVDYPFDIPNFPLILGTRLYAQALVEGYTGRGKAYRFTNTIGEVLTR